MKVLVNSNERKLVALRTITGGGIFFRNGQFALLIDDLLNVQAITQSLEDLLEESKDRTPIYEGDSVTIQF